MWAISNLLYKNHYVKNILVRNDFFERVHSHIRYLEQLNGMNRVEHHSLFNIVIKFTAVYLFTHPRGGIDQFNEWVKQMLEIFIDESDVWGDTQIDVFEFLAAFTDEADEDDVWPFFETIEGVFLNKIFRVLKSKNLVQISKALQIISNLIVIFDDIHLVMFEDRDFPDILFDLLETNSPTIQNSIYTILYNTFISSADLVSEFVSDYKVITWLLDKFTSSPSSSDAALKCLKALLSNFEINAVEDLVRDNPEIVEYFLSKVSVDLKNETMLMISAIVKNLIIHGDNAIENQIMMENPVKQYIWNSNDLLDKITEGQRHNNQLVSEAFMKIVVEHFERPENNLD